MVRVHFFDLTFVRGWNVYTDKRERHNFFLEYSSSPFPAVSLGFTILGEIFAYVAVF